MEKMVNLNLNEILNDDEKPMLTSLINSTNTNVTATAETTLSSVSSSSGVVDTLLKEINNSQTKTPVSVLQEICCKSHLESSPIYELVSMGGNAHEPIFNLKVSIGDLMVTSQGNSKKKAKQAAALNMISLLNQLGQNNAIVQQMEKIR